MQLRHDGHRVSDMLNDVPPDDLIEFVIGEWIRQIIQIVYDISRRSRINVHTDRARDFVCAATYIEYSSFARLFFGANIRLSLDMLGLHFSSSRVKKNDRV